MCGNNNSKLYVLGQVGFPLFLSFVTKRRFPFEKISVRFLSTRLDYHLVRTTIPLLKQSRRFPHSNFYC